MQALSWEMVCAIGERRAGFQIERPRIVAMFDNGKSCGEVEIVGTERGRVVVRKASAPEKRFAVSVSKLAVDMATGEHLERAVNWLSAWKAGGYKRA